MEPRCVLIVGAGASVADCARLRQAARPPLDAGFFRSASRSTHNQLELKRISAYLRDNYNLDPLADPSHDSLEGIMVQLYTDIFHPRLGSDAYNAFLGLLRVFNKQLATTTNNVPMGPRRLLFRVIRRHLATCGSASRLTIITFNQDIQVEKALYELHQRTSLKRGNVFSFPHMYGLGDVMVTSAGDQPLFPKNKDSDDCIRLLKLHGSLNWYSTSSKATPSKTALFNATRKLSVTARQVIDPDMRRGYGKGVRRMYTFPVVVPAVNHKSAILHQSLMPLWNEAEKSLSNATHVTIFGYSCPPADFESANMISRAFNRNTVCENLTIIDPQPRVLLRFVELTGMDSVSYFRSAMRYLEAAGQTAVKKQVYSREPAGKRHVA